MTVDHQLLLWLLLLPAGGAAVAWALGPKRPDLVRKFSLLISLATLVLAFLVAGRFMAIERAGLQSPSAEGAIATFKPECVPGSTAADPHATTWDVLTVGNSTASGPIQFYLGVDGLNVWLVVLTAVLFLPSVLISWEHIDRRVNEFYAWLLALQTCVIGVFLALDIMLFYVFFELSLVPLFFLIGIWGGPQRQYAARKFFLYTFVGSVLALLGILSIVLACHDRTGELTFSIPRLIELVHTELGSTDPEVRQYWANVQWQSFLLLMLGFAVKVPLMPFHTWLPLAHVEAPTAGSVDLAGVLLKIGSYGFLRLCIPLAPDISLTLGLPLVTSLAAAGIVYGAFCAFAQTDVKRLIAYSSISHLGLCMLGMYSLTAAGLTGSLLQMINHGLSTGALFLLIGMIYERYHTRDLRDYGGMATKMPLFAVFLVFVTMSSIGLPGLNGFVGEVLCLFGILQHEIRYGGGVPVLTVIAASGMILGAWYMITMLRRLLFGPLHEPHHDGHAVTDLKSREWLLLAPILALCLLLGVYPKPVINTAQPDLDRIVRIADAARVRNGIAPERAAPPRKP